MARPLRFQDRTHDPRGVQRALEGAHDAFLDSGSTRAVRDLVAESWQRSLAAGIDPESDLAPIGLGEDELAAVRAVHPLTTVMPVIRRLLVDDATDAGLLVAVSDAAGQLLYVEGPPHLQARAEAMHFVPGADWSESRAGTNAPGTALAVGRAVQILGAEHLARPVTPWSCSAAPVRDPQTHAVVGVIDVTGGPDVANPYTLSMVRATAAAAETELRLHQLLPALDSRPSRGVRTAREAPPRIDLLGRVGGVLHHGSTTTRLTLRHSELLWLLANAVDGLTADQLAVALSDEELPAVTIRAELSRLRAQVGPLHLESRPYRLTGPLVTDVDRLLEALHTGQLRSAVATYAGPLLPTSEAPAVVQARRDLHQQVRSALLASSHADALLTFADAHHGRDDLEIWQHALAVLPEGSPRRHQVLQRVDELERELG